MRSSDCRICFPCWRVLVDRPRPALRFLVLGKRITGVVAAEFRVARRPHRLSRTRRLHVGRGGAFREHRRLWLRGGFPRSYLAQSLAASDAWRRDFIRTFLERDLPQLGIGVAATTMHRFWTMLAHYHGQTWNASDWRGRSAWRTPRCGAPGRADLRAGRSATAAVA